MYSHHITIPFFSSDFVLSRAFDDHGDMTKARRYGWTTTVDTSQSYIRCFNQLKQMGVIPAD